MITFHKLKPKSLLIYSFIVLLIAIISYVKNVNHLFVIVLFVWTYLIVYSIEDIVNSIALFCFLIAFYIFLLGREVGFYYFNMSTYYNYLMKENNVTYKCLIVSLIFLFLGYSLYRTKNTTSSKSILGLYQTRNTAYLLACKYCYFFCLLFSLINILLRAVVVARYGYIASYTEEYANIGIPSYVSYISGFQMTSYCLYLGAFPDKKQAYRVLVIQEIYALLSLFSGSRFAFIAITLLALIYIHIRENFEGNWIPKNIYFWIAVSTPFLLLFLTAFDAIRIGQTFEFRGVLNSLLGFFDQQGGSINCIKRVMYYKEKLVDIKYSSFSSTRSVLFENIIARKVFGIETYTGNSIEHALHGHSLDHRLSYFEYGNGYLSGKGVGSCYIAELFHDFGFVGVAIGSIFYGYILKRVTSIKFKGKIIDGVLLIITFNLLHAPRGSFDSFVYDFLSLYSLLGFVVICLITVVLRKKTKRQLFTNYF